MTEKIRIARVIARLNVGGPALHVAALTARLSAHGFESRLFCGDVSRGEREMTEVLVREAVEPRRIPGLGRAIDATSDARAFATLAREIRAFRPHIVHTHTAKAGTLGRLAAWLCRTGVVVHTFHGHVFHGYFPPLVSRGFVAIERTLARGTDRIITISPRQFSDITERYRIAPPDRVSHIPLGFDLNRFASVPRMSGRLRAELGLRDEPLISSVGRLVSIKDHPLLLEAFLALGDPSAHLCIVGGGEREAALRELARELGIADRTHFLGFRSDLENILSDTDVVALTSHNEGTPVALIEALAAGCTPVSLSVGGVPDVLGEGRWGTLVADRDPKVLATALRDALRRHRYRTQENIEAATSYVHRKYGVERLVADHAALYRTLLVANDTLR